MSTLNKYFNSNNSYSPPIQDNTIIVRAKIPSFYENKVKRIIEVKGYSSYQDYLTGLFNKNKELEEIIIPYEILKLIDYDYNTLQGKQRG